jgi:hypothetical protein
MYLHALLHQQIKLISDPRCPDLTQASGSFSSVCLSPHSRSSSFQLIKRSPDLTSLRSVPRKRPYLSPFSLAFSFFLFSSRRRLRLRLSRSPSFVPHVRDSSSSVLTIPYTGSSLLKPHYHDSSFLTADHNLLPQGKNCESTLDVGVAPVLA